MERNRLLEAAGSREFGHCRPCSEAVEARSDAALDHATLDLERGRGSRLHDSDVPAREGAERQIHDRDGAWDEGGDGAGRGDDG